MRETEHLKGLDLIVEERMRQIKPLGYTIEHDLECHSPRELMRIGELYIDYAAAFLDDGITAAPQHPIWQETSIAWKPEPSAIENAAKGGAFVAAALDLLYAQMMGEKE